MTHLVLQNLVLLIVPAAGAVAFGLLVYRFVTRGAAPPAADEPGPGPGFGPGLPSAGPDDLSRSA